MATSIDNIENDIRSLIAKAAEHRDGREAMHFTQAALNAAQALVSLKLIESQENTIKK